MMNQPIDVLKRRCIDRWCEVSCGFLHQGQPIWTAVLRLAGLGRRTVDKLRHFNLDIITAYRPNIVILEVRTNDLSSVEPEALGSAIDDLVQFIFGHFSVGVICWCCVIRDVLFHMSTRACFISWQKTLNNYVKVVLYPPWVFCWGDRILTIQLKFFNYQTGFIWLPQGNTNYWGAIMKALSLL